MPLFNTPNNFLSNMVIKMLRNVLALSDSLSFLPYHTKLRYFPFFLF